MNRTRIQRPALRSLDARDHRAGALVGRDGVTVLTEHGEVVTRISANTATLLRAAIAAAEATA